jgi:hypothetical protein
MSLNECIGEDAVPTWFGELDYAAEPGPEMILGEPAEERYSLGEMMLSARLREANQQLNPARQSCILAIVPDTRLRKASPMARRVVQGV